MGVMVEHMTEEQWTRCLGEGGPDCCIYAAVDKDGFCCLRGTSMGLVVLARAAEKQMTALWIPADNCRNPEVSGVEELKLRGSL